MGVSKIRGYHYYIMGVPIIRSIVYWGLCCGPPFEENTLFWPTSFGIHHMPPASRNTGEIFVREQ